MNVSSEESIGITQSVDVDGVVSWYKNKIIQQIYVCLKMLGASSPIGKGKCLLGPNS